MLRLLDQLWGDRDGYGEIRAMRDGKVQQSFYRWNDIAGRVELRDAVNLLIPTHDIYFGVLLRTGESGKAGDCEPLVHWLWADVDKKSGATFGSLLMASVPPAQIVVDSGHGWHLYWRLRTPMRHTQAQEAMAAIASQIGGDAVGDPARILRLPSTFNRKADPALPVRILRWKNLDHGWREGDFDLRRVPTDRRKVGPVATGGKGTRSEDLFVFAMEGIRKGLSDEAIYEAMLTIPAGSKILEMPKARADKWVNLTIRKARKLLS